MDISELHLGTFLYDEKTEQKVLLTPEQYLISQQQAEFTSRKFLTYIINKENTPVSEPIQISDATIQTRHSIETMVSNKLNSFDRKRGEELDHFNSLGNTSEECELLHGYIQDRLDKLKTEENIIEHIVPILSEKFY